MKKTLTILLSLLLVLPASASQKETEKKDSPVKEHLQNHFKLYGFIRNFFVYDSRDSKAGTGDLFYYLPLDEMCLTDNSEDRHASPNFRFRMGAVSAGMEMKFTRSAVTSRENSASLGPSTTVPAAASFPTTYTGSPTLTPRPFRWPSV